jgi:type IV secretory pathway VirB10-like protein
MWKLQKKDCTRANCMLKASAKLPTMRTMQMLWLWVGLALALPCAAQWQWRDHNDKLVYSDRPPPSDIADKNILKRPGPARTALPQPAQPLPAPIAAAQTPGKPTGKDLELEQRRQQAEQQDAAKKAEQLQAQTKARADNCARARQAKATYDSGVRIARMNDNGEREIVDDATRAVEARRLQGIIASDCS